jgi:hypothetical protein
MSSCFGQQRAVIPFESSEGIPMNSREWLPYDWNFLLHQSLPELFSRFMAVRRVRPAWYRLSTAKVASSPMRRCGSYLPFGQ